MTSANMYKALWYLNLIIIYVTNDDDDNFTDAAVATFLDVKEKNFDFKKK